MAIDLFEFRFAQVVSTRHGPALKIGEHIIEIRSSDSEAHARALMDALRHIPHDSFAPDFHPVPATGEKAA